MGPPKPALAMITTRDPVMNPKSSSRLFCAGSGDEMPTRVAQSAGARSDSLRDILVLMSRKECGGPPGIRTLNQRIMSPLL